MRKNKSNTLQKIHHANVNVDFMKKDNNYGIQINGGTTTNVDVSVNNVMYVKKIIFEILLHVVPKTEKNSYVIWMIQRLSMKKL